MLLMEFFCRNSIHIANRSINKCVSAREAYKILRVFNGFYDFVCRNTVSRVGSRCNNASIVVVYDHVHCRGAVVDGFLDLSEGRCLLTGCVWVCRCSRSFA